MEAIAPAIPRSLAELAIARHRRYFFGVVSRTGSLYLCLDRRQKLLEKFRKSYGVLGRKRDGSPEFWPNVGAKLLAKCNSNCWSNGYKKPI